ncbi:MAG: VWA domain-containing protein [Desulfurococcaceae archaeon]
MSGKETGALRGINYDELIIKYRGDRVVKLSEILLSRGKTIPRTAGIDTFYSLYLPAPILNETSTCELCKAIVKTLTNTTEGVRLRTRSMLDTLLSTLTAAVYLSRLFEKFRVEEHLKGGHNSLRYEKIMNDAKEAAYEVLSEVENISRVRSALEGLHPGSISIFSTEDYSLELLRLAKVTDIKKIIEMLEGIKQCDIATSRRSRPFKKGERQGFVLGSDVERIVPSNFLYSDDVFYTRLAQGRLLLYSKTIEESMGSIYVLLDKSGSMEGEKILWAKAVALALYMKALRGGRDFYIRFFDSQPYSLMNVRRKPTSKDATKVFEYIARIKSAGGTDITRALVTATSDLSSNLIKGSTIVLVTDGIDRVFESPLKRNLKKSDTKLITVMIKGENKSLLALSKEYLKVVKLSREDIIQVIKAVDREIKLN